MTKVKEKKTTEKALEPYRPSKWLAPVEEMDRLFEDFFRRPFGSMWWPKLRALGEEIQLAPSVDIYEESDDIVVKGEFPGINKEDIEVNLTDGTITISGEKKKEEKIEKKNYFHLERSYGSFKRSFSLPSEVQTDKAKASFKDGVLEVRVPKTEEAKKKLQKVTIE
ncbi:MAG: Hsp20/alpha crystallin family protein [Nitrospirae bacterium]|nr:Hsp20/alpha crystallin family protein [Nitrospirota bacterium]